jgi:hypothetical protein
MILSARGVCSDEFLRNFHDFCGFRKEPVGGGDGYAFGEWDGGMYSFTGKQ